MRAPVLTPEVADRIDDAFRYRPWKPEQERHGEAIRDALADAAKAIVQHAPPGPRRTIALQKLVEVRMDCNAAITFEGRA